MVVGVFLWNVMNTCLTIE